VSDHFPQPVITPEAEPFWLSCQNGRMALQRCGACGHFWFPPSVLCPECWSTTWTWEEVAGAGTVFSYVTFRRVYRPAFKDLVPYAVAVVELAEGPRMFSRLVGVTDVSDVTCGMAVEVRYEALGEELTLPLFAPRT
jgi:uncharacterized protein